jgi:hypothetical protein
MSVDTNDIKYLLAGNAPILVDKNSGKIVVLGTAKPVEQYLLEYENQPRSLG